MNKSRLRALLALALLLAGTVGCQGSADSIDLPDPGRPVDVAGAALNVLLITVDDMGWDSLGVTGSPVPDITPNIDRLAGEGMLFTQAHVTIAICQPTRAVWMTGRYPHRSGALGFDPIDPDVPTLVEALAEAGFRTGLMAKTGHVVPSRLAAFDAVVAAKDLKNGRSPELYYEHAAAFFRQAQDDGQPFFLMANSQDPHRPFAASQQEVNAKARDATSKSEQYGGGFPETELAFAPEQIPVPGFLANLPAVRLEVAQYYTSVQRADATVGAVLRALDDSGMAERTLVMFLSDHGPSLPFAKANAWMHSTRTPWIVRWPGVVAAGVTDAEHMVAGIDLAPTILDAVGLDNLDGADGVSFLPVLGGEAQAGRDVVFTQVNTLSSGRSYAMRAVNGRQYGYIFNAWADGETSYRSEASGGLTFPAMRDAAARDQAVAARVNHYMFRSREELYDYRRDPDARENLIGGSEHAATAERFRAMLLEHMRSTNDPQLAGFEAWLAQLEQAPSGVQDPSTGEK
jgi:N-sulfoglucosamine sulfohydrolase